MIIHDLGAEATDIEQLRISGLIWREVGSAGYPDVSVIRYIDDSSDHRYGTLVYQAGSEAWRIVRFEYGGCDKKAVGARINGRDYSLREVIPALTKGGYHGAKQIASYMMKHCDLEKEKNDED